MQFSTTNVQGVAATELRLQLATEIPTVFCFKVFFQSMTRPLVVFYLIFPVFFPHFSSKNAEWSVLFCPLFVCVVFPLCNFVTTMKTVSQYATRSHGKIAQTRQFFYTTL